jgi:hypothetical protein
MPNKKIRLDTLSFEILTCIANHLTSKELSILSTCNKALYPLQWMDSFWKRFCQIKFDIHYNHPDQSYRELFIVCCKTLKGNKGGTRRLPCSHLSHSNNNTSVDQTIMHHARPHQCQRCLKEGYENLFICISPSCHQTSNNKIFL